MLSCKFTICSEVYSSIANWRGELSCELLYNGHLSPSVGFSEALRAIRVYEGFGKVPEGDVRP